MTLADSIPASWRGALGGVLASERFAALSAFVENAYATSIVYPPREKLFEAFRRTPFDKVRVVVFGQDPYHEPGQAQGLAFYVPPGTKTPPSLANIAKELGFMPDLSCWADEGVLLLNTVLTVEKGKAFSHRGRGWEWFTDCAAAAVAEKRSNVAFILWGEATKRKGAGIDRSRHFVVESAHPSPLSARRGFFGSDPFGRVNAYFASKGLPPVDWRAGAPSLLI